MMIPGQSFKLVNFISSNISQSFIHTIDRLPLIQISDILFPILAIEYVIYMGHAKKLIQTVYQKETFSLFNNLTNNV